MPHRLDAVVTITRESTRFARAVPRQRPRRATQVWGMAMSTILQCFCADEEIYKGDKDAMYAGADLKATVSNSNKGKFAKKSKVAAAPAEDEGDAVI